jgi:hypothetical protein
VRSVGVAIEDVGATAIEDAALPVEDHVDAPLVVTPALGDWPFGDLDRDLGGDLLDRASPEGAADGAPNAHADQARFLDGLDEEDAGTRRSGHRSGSGKSIG